MLVFVPVPSKLFKSIVFTAPTTSFVVICSDGSGYHTRGLFVEMDELSTSFKKEPSICLLVAVGAVNVRLTPIKTWF